MRQLIHTFTLFISILFISVLSTPANAVSVNAQAPNFTLKSLQGKNLKLSEQAGNVVMLNFWASWCGPCRKEMPLMNDLYNKYEKLGFVILGVNVEQEQKLAKSFLRDTPVDFPILFDSSNTVSKAHDVIAMPTTVMIDRNGKVRYIHKGYKTGDEKKYKKMVKQLIRE